MKNQNFWVLNFVLSDQLNTLNFITNIVNCNYISIRVQMDHSYGILHSQYKHFLRYISIINKPEAST